jgi:peptidoglycan/xylan/chitin deacetylase (PgdA/CDA1 family)
VIARCLDGGAALIARYRDNREAAASYTFDDGYGSSSKIAGIFEERGMRASFYINPGNVAAQDWAIWRGLRDSGHEIGNHSLTHTVNMGDATLTDKQLDTEINDARRMLEQRLGAKPMVFAFPWHSYSTRALAMASQSHLAVRNPDIGDNSYHFVFFDQEHGAVPAQDPVDANKELSDTVAQGGWFVAAGHGVDGDGWSPVTSRFLADHLTFAMQYGTRLWVDTYLNVARYRKCRALLNVSVTSSAADRMLVKLAGNVDAAICSDTLTVAIPLLDSPQGGLQAHNAAGTSVALSYVAGKMLLNLKPGEQVTVEITKPR